MTRAQAAAYCQLTPQGFDRWVRQSLLPGPIPGTRRWDRRAIDRALDRLNGSTAAENNGSPLEQWKKRRGR